MNEQTVALVEKLANQLGTTADKIFAIYMKQAPISSVLDIWGVTVLTIACGLVIKWGIKRNDSRHDDNMFGILASAVAIVVGTVTITAFCWNLPSIMSGLFNPEYWALERILNAVGRLK